jgi:hypothetical protein
MLLNTLKLAAFVSDPNGTYLRLFVLNLQTHRPPPLTGGGWGEGENSQSCANIDHFTPTLALPRQGGGDKKLK